jgi:hypothetical protein
LSLIPEAVFVGELDGHVMVAMGGPTGGPNEEWSVAITRVPNPLWDGEPREPGPDRYWVMTETGAMCEEALLSFGFVGSTLILDFTPFAVEELGVSKEISISIPSDQVESVRTGIENLTGLLARVRPVD